jgi:hypothetical protein
MWFPMFRKKMLLPSSWCTYEIEGSSESLVEMYVVITQKTITIITFVSRDAAPGSHHLIRSPYHSATSEKKLL